MLRILLLAALCSPVLAHAAGTVAADDSTPIAKPLPPIQQQADDNSTLPSDEAALDAPAPPPPPIDLDYRAPQSPRE